MDRTTLVKIGRFLWAICLAVVLATACKTSRAPRHGDGPTPSEAAAEAVADSLWQAVCSAQRLPETWSAGYQIQFSAQKPGGKSGDKSLRLSGQLRMVGDSLLWLSGGMLGLEAFRAWSLGDSLWVMNRLEGTVDVYAYADWRQRLSVAGLDVWVARLADGRAVRAFLAAVLSGRMPDLSQAFALSASPALLPAVSEGVSARRLWRLEPVAVGAAQAQIPFVLWCETSADSHRLLALRALEENGAGAEDGTPLFELHYPDADHWQLTGRQGDGAAFSVQVVYSKRRENGEVEVSTEIPKKYRIRYAD